MSGRQATDSSRAKTHLAPGEPVPHQGKEYQSVQRLSRYGRFRGVLAGPIIDRRTPEVGARARAGGPMRTRLLACRQESGTTLLELMLALTLAALLVGLGVPMYGAWIAEYQMMNFARDLAGNMNTARGEAIKRGFRVNLCKSADHRTCATSGDWAQGFVVYLDVD